MAAGSYLPVLGSLLMTAVIIKVSGVAMLEKTLKITKPQYAEYEKRTSAFIPWFRKGLPVIFLILCFSEYAWM
jgi:steroid 5-alpha reductase family enzyme